MTHRKPLFYGMLACALLATVAFTAAPAMAAADLQITSMSVQGTAKKGTCNKVDMTVKNNGDAFTGNATLDIAVITYQQGNSNLSRAQKSLFISPLQGGQQVSFTVSDVEFVSEGQMTVQALVDSTGETPESNEGNNSSLLNTSVYGSCTTYGGTTPLTRASGGCDLELIFLAPSGTSVPYNQATTYTVQAKNLGKGSCESTKTRLYRYNSGTATGYGSAVGGTRNIWVIPALSAGQAATNNWSDKPMSKGAITYAPKFLGPWNDDNNNNHRPTKTVKSQ